MATECPVCESEVLQGKGSRGPGGDEVWYTCPRCGDYHLRALDPTILQKGILNGDPGKIATLSHWIRRRHESEQRKLQEKQGRRIPIDLDRELINSILKDPRPSLTDQEDNFVRWIGDNSKTFDQYINVDKFAIVAIVGSATFDEFVFVFGHLRDKGIIQYQGGEGNIYAKTRLSFPGWERHDELKRATSGSRKAFMAMPYNEPELDSVVENIFRDAVRQTGFDLFVLRDRPIAGLIDNRLRAEIRAARFLIADLTHRNPGAYWEAGYAEGLGKPVIYTCERKVFGDSKRKPHFNTNHHQTVLWDSKKPEDAARELKTTIRATLSAEAKLTDD